MPLHKKIHPGEGEGKSNAPQMPVTRLENKNDLQLFISVS